VCAYLRNDLSIFLDVGCLGILEVTSLWYRSECERECVSVRVCGVCCAESNIT
jgi:hypothetical protein